MNRKATNHIDDAQALGVCIASEGYGLDASGHIAKTVAVAFTGTDGKPRKDALSVTVRAHVRRRRQGAGVSFAPTVDEVVLTPSSHYAAQRLNEAHWLGQNDWSADQSFQAPSSARSHGGFLTELCRLRDDVVAFGGRLAEQDSPSDARLLTIA